MQSFGFLPLLAPSSPSPSLYSPLLAPSSSSPSLLAPSSSLYSPLLAPSSSSPSVPQLLGSSPSFSSPSPSLPQLLGSSPSFSSPPKLLASLLLSRNKEVSPEEVSPARSSKEESSVAANPFANLIADGYALSKDSIRAFSFAYLNSLLSMPIISEFLLEKGLDKDEFSNTIISAKLPPGTFLPSKVKSPLLGTRSSGMTIELARNIVDNKHDYNWKGDGLHCIYFLVSGDRPYTFCSREMSTITQYQINGAAGNTTTISGRPISTGIICPSCIDKPKAKDLALISLDELEKYRIQKQQASLTAARTKKRAMDEPTKKLRDKLAKKGSHPVLLSRYTHLRDHAYENRLGLVLKPYNGWYNAIGIDKANTGTIRKITLSELELIKGIDNIEPMTEALDEEALKYVLRNNPRAYAVDM